MTVAPAFDDDVDGVSPRLVPPCPPAGDGNDPARDARWALVLPHADRLRRIAARRLSCADEVDDVVQEALLRAATFERLDEAYVGQFLTSVTVRLCADVQRERSRQLRVGVRDAVRSVYTEDPHEALLDHDEARWLYAECLKLPVRECAVVLARARGLSVREAAGTLGVGVKSAEAALTKARHRMRRVVQGTGANLMAFARRGRHTTVPVVVSASLGALVVGGALHPLLDRHDTTPANGTMRIAAVPTIQRTAARAATVRPAAAGIARRAALTTVPARPVAKRPPARQVLRTERLGDPDNLVGTHQGIAVTEEDEYDTFQESLDRCLAKGISLDPQHLICDDRERPRVSTIRGVTGP